MPTDLCEIWNQDKVKSAEPKMHNCTMYSALEDIIEGITKKIESEGSLEVSRDYQWHHCGSQVLA